MNNCVVYFILETSSNQKRRMDHRCVSNSTLRVFALTIVTAEVVMATQTTTRLTISSFSPKNHREVENIFRTVAEAGVTAFVTTV